MRNYNIFFAFLILLVAESCKKFVEADIPVTTVTSGNVYKNDFSAISVMTAIYGRVSSSRDGSDGITSLSLYGELIGDNLSMTSTNNIDIARVRYYQNNLVAKGINGNDPPEFWRWFYDFIYRCNAVLEGVDESTTLTPIVKQQLMGEAYFFRAFSYFYLMNLYGDVPLPLTTNYKINSVLPRADKNLIYQQIISDLKSAQQFLHDDYMDVTLLKSTSERIRPNKGAATALLARTYLFAGQYSNAAQEATSLIENNSKYRLVALANVFEKNSEETIWSLQPVNAGQNTWEARVFLLPATGPAGNRYSITLSSQLISAFETNDQRMKQWTGNVTANNNIYFYAAKYKAGLSTTTVSEYEVVLRLAELYLIRAECNIKLGHIEEGINDLNILRDRANDKTLPDNQQLKPLPTNLDEATALLAVDHERQVELFTEWGHRWFDLVRRKRIDEIMSVVCPLKGGVWQSYKTLFPINQVDIDLNYSLEGKQNPGY